MALVIRVGEINAVWDGEHWAADDPSNALIQVLTDLAEEHRRGFPGYLPYSEGALGDWLVVNPKYRTVR